MFKSVLSLFLFTGLLHGADVVGSKDPAGLKRYEGSSIIGYQAPKQDEYFYSNGKAREFGKRNPFGDEGQKLEGHVSRVTYLVPDAGRSTYEVYTNYKSEFEQLGLEVVYAPEPDKAGWFGPTYANWEEAGKLGQILEYNEAAERYLIARTSGASPTYYVLFVTSYQDGVIPRALEGKLQKGMPLVQLDIIAPANVESRMKLVKADEMEKRIGEEGGVALYGILFDFNSDALKAESKPTLDQIAELLKKNSSLKLYVVGHTDQVGTLEFNRDLSDRRAKSVVKALVSDYQISQGRLASAGVAFLAPVASNATEEGRTKNRRVVLISQGE